MPVAPGTKLNQYEISAPLGAGGMGEVYRARDTRLGRDVAIKILPAELSSNEDRLRRFEQEARSASALNHPNIITIYDTGTAGALFFIAMEFVEGKTLREMLAGGPIALRKAIQVAAQIAEGLAKAHESGIVHRDLKPENIMVSNDGYVKILDFGLAKLLVPVSDGQVSALPTSARTDAGTILGTVGYMSPEQASSGDVQFHSDQFSLGAILYEMFAGKRAFQKKTTVETMAAIINQEPDPIAGSGSLIPPPVRWAIERCLEKNPADRYASTRDLARDLASIRDHFSEVTTSSSTDIPGGTVGVSPSSRGKWRKALDVAGVLLIATLAALAFYFWKASNPVETEPVSYHRLTYRRGAIYSSQFAPDGQTIVYSASFDGKERQLYQTRTGRSESNPLGISNADVLSVSKTGDMLILLHKDKNVLARVPITGGVPRELAEDVFGADWAPDGERMVLSRLKQGRWNLEFPEGKVLYDTARMAEYVRFSPKGDLIAFDEHVAGGSNGVIKIVDLQGKQIAVSPESYPNRVVWNSDGTEVWFTTLSEEAGGGDELHALSVTGAHRIVTKLTSARLDDIATNGRLLINAYDLRGSLMASSGGTPEVELSWLDQPQAVDFSPDGKTVLMWERGAGSESPSGTIFIRNIDGSPAVRLAAGVASTFTDDGKWVFGNVNQDQLILVPVGPGNTRTFEFADLKNTHAIGVLPGDNTILFGALDQNQQSRIYKLNTANGKPEAITEAGAFALDGKTVSPDGKFLIGRDSNGSLQVYLIAGGKPKPVPAIQPREEVAQWSRDGSSLYVFTPDAFPLNVYRVNLTTGARELFKEIVPPDPVGITGFSSVLFGPDERTYAYSFVRAVGTLYLLDGMK